MVTETYLPIYLCNITDSSDSFYSCDSSESSDNCDSSDSCESSDKKFSHIFLQFFCP